MRAVYALVVLTSLASCVRDPAEPICADVAVGGLVITELHGDEGTPWVEVHNASGAEIDLAGMRLVFHRLDGSAEVVALVRRALPIAAGGYRVLGHVADDQRPSFIDYGFAADWHGAAWLANAAVDIELCGTRIDRMQYSALPRSGTYALGAAPPTAEANDVTARWCRDAAPGGTPREANPPCP